jgi:hypothetical protein
MKYVETYFIGFLYGLGFLGITAVFSCKVFDWSRDQIANGIKMMIAGECGHLGERMLVGITTYVNRYVSPMPIVIGNPVCSAYNRITDLCVRVISGDVEAQAILVGYIAILSAKITAVHYCVTTLAHKLAAIVKEKTI